MHNTNLNLMICYILRIDLSVYIDRQQVQTDGEKKKIQHKRNI